MITFTHLGAFRLPLVENLSTFAYGGSAIAHNPTTNSVFVTGHTYQQMVAEVSVPEFRKAPVNKLAVGKLLAGFRDVTGGALAFYKTPNGNRIGGLHVHTGLLHWTMYAYYNVGGEIEIPSHGINSLDMEYWFPPRFIKGATPHQIAGYMTTVPSPHREKLGVMITGKSNAPGEGNRNFSSEGPACYGLDWKTPTAKKLFSYTVEKPATYETEAGIEGWKGANSVGGVGIKSQRIIYLVRVGMAEGDFYGEGKDFPGACSEDKGYHAPPYRWQAWVYRVSDFKKVGEIDLTGAYNSWCSPLGGASFDRAQSIFYVVEPGADLVTNPYEPQPVVHGFKVGNVS